MERVKIILIMLENEEALKKNNNMPVYEIRKWLIGCIIGLSIYIFLSIGLLMLDRGSHKQAIYGLSRGGGVGVTEILTKESVYRQYFYAPQKITGIQIFMATYGTIPQNGVIVGVGDANTDKILGKLKVSADEIEDNHYLNVKFKDFILEEGEKYFFEIYTKKNTDDTIACWLTQEQSRYVSELYCRGEEIEDTYMIFDLLYDYNGKGLVLWLFVTGFFVIGVVVQVEYKFKDKALLYNVVMVGFVLLIAIILLSIYAKYIW